jgi:hypothetical protein
MSIVLFHSDRRILLMTGENSIWMPMPKVTA